MIVGSDTTEYHGEVTAEGVVTGCQGRLLGTMRDSEGGLTLGDPMVVSGRRNFLPGEAVEKVVEEVVEKVIICVKWRRLWRRLWKNLQVIYLCIYSRAI